MFYTNRIICRIIFTEKVFVYISIANTNVLNALETGIYLTV